MTRIAITQAAFEAIARSSRRNSETSPSTHDPHRHHRRQRHLIDDARGRACMAVRIRGCLAGL
jgi:hypothetical protein